MISHNDIHSAMTQYHNPLHGAQKLLEALAVLNPDPKGISMLYRAANHVETLIRMERTLIRMEKTQ